MWGSRFKDFMTSYFVLYCADIMQQYVASYCVFSHKQGYTAVDSIIEGYIVVTKNMRERERYIYVYIYIYLSV